jgi:hypothetical protein
VHPSVPRFLLARAVAYERQVREHGELPARVVSALAAVAKGQLGPPANQPPAGGGELSRNSSHSSRNYPRSRTPKCDASGHSTRKRLQLEWRFLRSSRGSGRTNDVIGEQDRLCLILARSQRLEIAPVCRFEDGKRYRSPGSGDLANRAGVRDSRPSGHDETRSLANDGPQPPSSSRIVRLTRPYDFNIC